MKHLICVFFILIFISCTSEKSSQFSLQKIQSGNREISSLQKGTGFEDEVLKVVPDSAEQSLVIWQGKNAGIWKDAKYLVCEIWHQNEYSAVINIEFFRNVKTAGNIVAQSGSVAGDDKEKPRMSAKIGVLPKLKTKVIFPLEHLDGQEIFMQRFPRQLKGTVLGSRMKPEEITKVTIRFGPYQQSHFTPEFEISAIYLSDELPEPYPEPEEPVVDQFGQWARKDWPRKTESLNELQTMLQDQLAGATFTTFPKNWSKYGGWKEKKFEATGFFRTQYDGKRWWLVDPDGFAFVSVGVDCIRNNVSGVISGQEDLFKWLPDTTYKEAYSSRGETVLVDFYRTNLMRVFGDKWQDDWEQITSGQIREFGINTIGNWSDIDFARKAGIPYVLPLSGFPSTEVQLYRDFPDVFSDEYTENAKQFAQQLNEFKNDPWLIGYFLRNEPHWAFGAHDIAFEMFGTSQQFSIQKSYYQMARKEIHYS